MNFARDEASATSYQHDLPGLYLPAVHRMAAYGIGKSGGEATSPAHAGEANFQAHMACAELRITPIECLPNFDTFIGCGRLRFIGFPLKIRDGTAGSIRAAALFG